MKIIKKVSVGGVLFIMASTAHGQLCNSAITPIAPDSRYQDNGDYTVTDLHTGLMWQQCSTGQSGSDCSGIADAYIWTQALQKPQILNANGGFAGYSDWRLPNRNELASLVEAACYIPAINQSLFPKTFPGDYWSSSPNAAHLFHTWSVSFIYGQSLSDYRSSTHRVRLVRSGS